uniref:Uncharacterized protein n=1 Tax=Mola mola TaxID=94237 RepID=A0A3Q3WR52_MOLML
PAVTSPDHHNIYFLCSPQVNGRFPHCQFQWEMQREALSRLIYASKRVCVCSGCRGEWDNVSCWQSAAVGEVMTLPCPSPLLHLFGKNGECLFRSGETAAAQSGSAPAVHSAAISMFRYHILQLVHTPTPSVNTLLCVCVCRRLHCTRNYIHLNLFVSFMLRAVAVFTKDTLLFSDDETTDCSTQPSLVGCKASLVLFNYFIMANFFWLLVEGLYLHTLLLVIYNYSIRFSIYMLIGWGRLRRRGTTDGCFTLTQASFLTSAINFILFISIIRILVQKLRCTDVGGNERSQYRRLAKSTLLLIPLFGINYVVFVYLMEPSDKNMNYIKIFFELGLGSFQGLIVAVLYCFLNSEVQGELRRTWRSFSLKRYVGRDYRLHAMTVSRNGTENSAQLPRDSRAQSILQTETTVL